MSFFDEDEPPTGPDDDEEDLIAGPATEERPPAPRRPPARRPPPRQARPSRPGAAADRQTLLVRRAVALGAGLVVLVIIVLIINSLLNSQKRTAMRNYSQAVAMLVQNADANISDPLFQTLVNASNKAELNVETSINNARQDAASDASQAAAMSVPGSMAEAQRDLLLMLDLRTEALTKLSGLVSTALAGNTGATAAYAQIAGQMELLLTSDVIYSQRVAPLISQTLAASNITGADPPAETRFLPNTGWLDPTTVQDRISGESAAAQAPFVPGNHGSALNGVSVGGVTLQSGTLNTVSGAGAGVTFTVGVQDSGAFNQYNVKVDVTITRAGRKALKESKILPETTPGNTTNAVVSFPTPPLGNTSVVKVNIEGVEGENDLANNVGSYDVLFEQ
ncbi:MAG TPA: hypothetical protein VHX88_13665 [Solirubrobacteraceae bacterium]|nr:hypothetical protein [Solirubrobacteraceae bacterium]